MKFKENFKEFSFEVYFEYKIVKEIMVGEGGFEPPKS